MGKRTMNKKRKQKKQKGEEKQEWKKNERDEWESTQQSLAYAATALWPLHKPGKRFCDPFQIGYNLG